MRFVAVASIPYCLPGFVEPIREIARSIILDKAAGERLVTKIRDLIEASNIAEADRDALFQLIETEIISLHEGNAARFKVLPSEFQA